MRKINSKHIDTQVNHVFYYLVLHAGPNVANFGFLFEIICIKKLNCFLILFDRIYSVNCGYAIYGI
jgi:hypothetical protein